MKRKILITALSFCCVLSLFGCSKKKTDLTSTHTTAAKETMASTAAPTEAIQIETTAPKGTAAPKESESIPSVSSSIETYKEGNISIEYPSVHHLTNASIQEKVNQLLKDHALEFIKAYEADAAKDSLSIECEVIAADRKKITAVYQGTYKAEGAAYPSNIFYTNTIDTALGEDMELTDYADPYTLAGYILSEDCRFVEKDPELLKELMALRSHTSIEEYTEMFRLADFPYKEDADNKDAVSFPVIFSYEDQGTIYVALPVPHALGDYALVEYCPETK